MARNGTPAQFGVFSLFLIIYVIVTGFNRSVPHFIAMTMQWEDERARSAYFFLPPMVIGAFATPILVPLFALLDRSFAMLPLFLLPLLFQDAVRMHAFAVQKPQVALASDAVWLAVEGAGFFLVSTAASTGIAWGLGGLGALLVTRPWQIRLRFQRRSSRIDVLSATLEYAILAGLGFLTPILAAPIITVLGVGALQGANVIKGPIILLVQGLLFHRMAGPPISPSTCVREAFRLSGTTVSVALLSMPALFFLRSAYGPVLLGSTWPQVEPLVLPALLTVALGGIAFGPSTVVRKMGLFALSAKLQAAFAPAFVALPLLGAAIGGPRGFLYATACAYALFAGAWWLMLSKVATAVLPRPTNPCTEA